MKKSSKILIASIFVLIAIFGIVALINYLNLSKNYKQTYKEYSNTALNFSISLPITASVNENNANSVAFNEIPAISVDRPNGLLNKYIWVIRSQTKCATSSQDYEQNIGDIAFVESPWSSSNTYKKTYCAANGNNYYQIELNIFTGASDYQPSKPNYNLEQEKTYLESIVSTFKFTN